jgi:hypothetical protein
MKKIFGLFAFTLFFASQLLAWGDLGHMAMAKIAQDKLKTPIRESCDKILLEDPFNYSDMTNFVSAAVWADEIRDRGLGFLRCFHGSIMAYDPEGILSQERKATMLLMRDRYDITTAIRGSFDALQNPRCGSFEKRIALRFLLHCVGDVHQPLHCCWRFSKKFPTGDHAAVDMQVKTASGDTMTLHQFWDLAGGALAVRRFAHPFDSATYNMVYRVAHEIATLYPESSFSPSEIQNINFELWRDGSYQIACDVAYGLLPSDAILTQEYAEKVKKVALRQIALAAYRLAYLLNTMKLPSSG